jgi:hypothetical protein
MSLARRSVLVTPLLSAAVVACGMLIGCDQRQDVYSYDPKVDSVAPPALAGTDLSILEDQKSRPRPTLPAAPAVAPAGTRPAASPLTPGTPATPAAATPGATPGAAPTPEPTTAAPPPVPTGAGTVPPPPITE